VDEVDRAVAERGVVPVDVADAGLDLVAQRLVLLDALARGDADEDELTRSRAAGSAALARNRSSASRRWRMPFV
jgi:hypothetical protein